MKVIIFCVNYNSFDELEGYLNSLEISVAATEVELTVVVVDNSDTFKRIDKKYSFEIVHLYTGSNLGYFGGISYGIKRSNKSISKYNYSIISNVDLQVQDNFFVELANLHIPEEIGCIAPKIFSIGENRDRNPKVLERYSKRKLEILRLMYKFPILNNLYTSFFFRKRREKVETTEQKLIYAAHGSFMIFTKKVSSFLKEMEYPVFMFGEELYIAEHLRKMNLKTLYLPNLVIKDNDHASTGRMKSKFYYKCNYEAMDMVIKEFFSE